MGERVDSSTPLILYLFIVLIALFYIWAFPSEFTIYGLFLGGVVGLALGFLTRMRELKSVEQKGEYKSTAKTVAYGILVAVVWVAILWYLGSSSLTYGLAAFAAESMAIGFYGVTRSVTALRWERRFRKLLMYDGFWVSRQYAIPKPNQEGSKAEQ